MKNTVALHMGEYVAGEPVMINFVDHFISPIEDIKGSCSCQVQKYELLDATEFVGKDKRYTYRIVGQITTGPHKAIQNTFKTLTIKLEDGTFKHYKIMYSLYLNSQHETPDNEKTITTSSPNDGSGIRRVFAHIRRPGKNLK